MWNDVLVVTILHQKSSRNAAKLSETELLIEMQGNLVGCYDSIELQNPSSLPMTMESLTSCSPMCLPLIPFFTA